MAKMEMRKIAEKELQSAMAELWKSFSLMAKQGNSQIFLQHLLTESEKVMLARRILVAKALLKGMSHRSIAEKLHVGLHTVKSVDRWLAEYKEYRQVIPSLCKNQLTGSRDRSSFNVPHTFRWIRKKYPLHFLILNLLLDAKKEDHTIL